MAVSFSLSKGAPRPAAAVRAAMAEEEEEAKPTDYVTSFEDNVVNSSIKEEVKGPLVIPCRETVNAKANLASAGAANPAPTESTSSALPQEKTLEQEAIEAILKEVSGETSSDKAKALDTIPLLMRNRLPNMDGARTEDEVFRRDVVQRPDEASLAEYESTPIEQFGAAMLRGMGWKDGEAIGGINKGLLQPVEFVARPLGLGLGAQRDSAIMPTHKKAKKFIKPGETREPAPSGPMVDATGRVRHIKGIDEKLTHMEKLAVVRDAYVVILSGPHEGHCGRVRRLRPDAVDVELALGGAMVAVPEEDLAPVDKKEYAFRLNERRRDRAAPDVIPPSQSKDNDESDGKAHRDLDTRGESNGREEKKEKKSDKDRGSRDKEKEKDRIHERERERDKSSRREDRDPDRSETKRPRKEQTWVQLNLRVRMVSEKYAGGAYYNKKVVVRDVPAPGECVCMTDNGKYLEGVREKDLETVVPRDADALVMVVRGPGRGSRGKLIQRLLDKEQVVVQLAGEGAARTFGLDDVCEYVGERTEEDW
eukprot:m.176872 g.176872  ORF g.176872 m.176872 type:complete len:536 (+) comp15345_c5_seq27:1032-2639(+)